MDVELKSPANLDEGILTEIFQLVKEGSELNSHTLNAGLHRAELIAFIIENGK